MKKLLSSKLFLLTVIIILTILLLKIIKNYSLSIIPFLFSVLIVIVTRKTVSIIERMTGLSSKTAAKVSLMISYFVVVAILLLLGFIIYRFLCSIKEVSPIFINEKITAFSTVLKNNINPSIVEKICKYVLDLSVSVVSVIGNVILNIPQLIISIAFSVISSFFIVSDYENIKEFLYKQFEKKTLNKIKEFKNV